MTLEDLKLGVENGNIKEVEVDPLAMRNMEFSKGFRGKGRV
jgi:hypothetical protein